MSDSEISKTERRKLEQFPEITKNNILNKSFVEDFDSYVLDQFVLRDYFRQIKANFNYKVFRKVDNNRIYFYNNQTALPA